MAGLPRKWHIGRVTGRTVIYGEHKRRGRKPHPQTLLRTMLPAGCRIKEMSTGTSGNTITATITGLTPDEIEEIQEDFENEFGLKLDLKGQLSLF